MSENTFPVYTADKIVDFYRKHVLTGPEAKQFTKNDLTPTPKPEAVQTLYMRVLHLLYRFTPECHSMVPLLENIQNPVYHEGITTILSVNTRMRQFLPMCMVFDFSLSDLLVPDKKRTLTILSAIMNFIHFRNERMDDMLEKQTQFRSDTERLQVYIKGSKEAEKKIQILTTIPPEQQAEANELSAALSELNAATVREHQEVNIMNESIAELKSKIAEKNQKLAHTNVDVMNLKEDLVKLKSQIVESPEELKGQMEKMKEKVKNIKNSMNEANERVVELQNMVQNVNHMSEIHQEFSLLQELEGNMSSSQKNQEEYTELMSHYERKEKELKNVVMEESHLKRTVDMKLDKVYKQNLRLLKIKEMREQHHKEVLGQCNQIHQKREEMADKIQDIVAETQQLKTKIKSLRDVCSMETEKAQVLFDTLSSALDDLHRRIDAHVLEIKLNAQQYKRPVKF